MEKQGKFNLNDILILFIGLFTTGFLVLPYKLKQSISNFNIYIILVGLLLLLLLNIKKVFLQNRKRVIVLFVEILILLISLLTNNGGFGSIIFFISILLVLLIFDSVKINKKTANIIGIVSLLSWGYLLINKIKGINTNVASYQTFLLYLLAMPYVYTKIKSKNNKIIIFMIFTVIMILNAFYYDCRTVALATIVIFILKLIQFKKFKSEKIKKILFFSITIGSLLIVALYLYLHRNGINIDMSGISNKSLYSGREIIWNYMITTFLKGHMIFGIGSNFVQYGFTNIGVHNYMLNILIVFGIPNFIMFIYMLYDFFERFFAEEVINKKNVIYIIEIIAIFIIEFFETHLISSYAISVMLMLSIFFFTEKNIEIEEGSKNENIIKDK